MLNDEAGGGLLSETGVAVLKLGRSDDVVKLSDVRQTIEAKTILRRRH